MTAAAAESVGVGAVDQLLVWAAAAGAITALAALAWRIIRTLLTLVRRLTAMADDLLGAPARPGHDARPGVMARMARIEDCTTRTAERMASVESRVGRIEHELHPNGGGSLRDALDRVDQRTARIRPPPRRWLPWHRPTS